MSKTVALFPVSEIGEFMSLLEIARRVRNTLGLHPVFIFRGDYGALTRDAQIAERNGFSWIWEHDTNQGLDLRDSTEVDDYLPTYYEGTASTEQRRRAASRVARALAVFALIQRGRFAAIAILSVVLLFLLPLRLLARPFRSVAGRSRGGLSTSLRTARDGTSRRLRLMNEVFDRFAPGIVISGQDYPLSITAVAAKIAEERGIKTIIIPFSMTPTTKEIAESFAERRINRVRSRMKRRLISQFGRKWLHLYRGRTYSRLSIAGIVAAELNDLDPPVPWLPNSGRGIILAPSQQSVDYCTSAGIPESQLVLTGALWNDQLISSRPSRDERYKKLLEEMNIGAHYWRYMRMPSETSYKATETTGTAGRRLLIISWPPNQWPRKATGFSTYEAFSKAIVEMLAALVHAGYVNVAVSLHPTVVGTPVADLIVESGLFVLDDQLINVIDCADIFVATVSSTLLWSLQLGIPSINFDPYRYNYREFSQAGMIDALSLGELRARLISLIDGDDAYESTKNSMMERREYWTTTDGNSGDRILQSIKAYTKDRSQSAEAAVGDATIS